MVKDGMMDKTHWYPLRFEPIYQYRSVGGRRLASLLSAPLPGDGPIGEAWVLSDRTDHQAWLQWSAQGQTLGRCDGGSEITDGSCLRAFSRFPLLLKFLTHMRCSQCKYIP